MALIGFLPLLLWAGWSLPPESWNAPARVLWWFALLGGVVLIGGLWGQMCWPGLAAEGPSQFSGFCKSFFCAEFFLWPLLCPDVVPGRAVCLPWLSYAVQAGAALGIGLLFDGRDDYRCVLTGRCPADPDLAGLRCLPDLLSVRGAPHLS